MSNTLKQTREEFIERPSTEALTEPLFNLTTGSCSCSDNTCNICRRESEVLEAWMSIHQHCDHLEAQLKDMEKAKLRAEIPACSSCRGNGERESLIERWKMLPCPCCEAKRQRLAELEA